MMHACLFFLVISQIVFADLEKEIDKHFIAYQGNVPGASVLLIQDGNVFFSKSYGLANLEDRKVSHRETHYRLASLTKQFTAMSILRLIHDGKLKLEDSLQDVFPDFPGYGKKILLRHILTHTSGLIDYEDLIAPGSPQVSDADVLQMMKNKREGYFQPGSQYRYSNSGYCVLSQVVEKATGVLFSKYLEEKILRPIGMKSSIMYRKESEIPHRAFGYSSSGSEGFERTDQSVTSATQGDGGLYTSIAELSFWDAALYEETIVPRDLLKLMFTPGTLNDGTRIAYGFGWVIDQYRNLLRHSHTGSTIGFRTAIQRYPDRRFTVVVLVNRSESTPWNIATKITDEVLLRGLDDRFQSEHFADELNFQNTAFF